MLNTNILYARTPKQNADIINLVIMREEAEWKHISMYIVMIKKKVSRTIATPADLLA